MGPVINAVLLGLHVTVAAYQFFVLPIFLLPLDSAWALTLIPLIGLNNPLWSLVHETIHGSFHADSGINRVAGRVLSICYGAPWRVVRIGHLLHHRFNRTPLDRVEVFDPSASSRFRSAPGYYAQLMGGLYLTQILSIPAFLFPRGTLVAASRRFLDKRSYNAQAAAALLRPNAIREVRIDGALIIGLLVLSAAAYGSAAWLLVAILAARALCISFLDYVYHYGSPLDDKLHAYNLTLPPVLQRLLLNFNLHAVHHRHPSLPWYRLPARFAQERDRFAGSYGRFALRQLRGPIPMDRLPS